MTNQTAITILKNLEQILDDYCELNDEDNKAFHMAITALELFGNSEQLQNCKTGKWIYNSPITMKCDLCGLVIKDWDWNRFKFCPNCGADMRETKE